MRTNGQSTETEHGITLAIVTHSPASAEAICHALQDASGFELLGYVDARSAFTAALHHAAPDVVILEDAASMAETAANVRRSRTAVPGAKLVLLSAPERLSDAASHGADAVIGLSCLEEGFGVLVGELVAGNLRFTGQPMRRDRAPSHRDLDLTPRQAAVLRLVAEGHPDSVIAAQLWVTAQTVRVELAGLYEKLGVGDRTEAAHYARIRGLVDSGQALPDAAARTYAAAAA